MLAPVISVYVFVYSFVHVYVCILRDKRRLPGAEWWVWSTVSPDLWVRGVLHEVHVLVKMVAVADSRFEG